MPAVVTPCTVTAAVAACPDVLLVAGGNHGQLVIGIVIEIVDPAQNGRFVDLLEDRISHPMRNMPVDIVAYRIVAQFSARKELIAHKRRIIGLIDISVVGTIFGLLAPRTVVVDEARGPLRQRQGGGITVGIGYVDPRRAVVVGIVFVQIEVGRGPRRFRQAEDTCLIQIDEHHSASPPCETIVASKVMPDGLGPKSCSLWLNCSRSLQRASRGTPCRPRRPCRLHPANRTSIADIVTSSMPICLIFNIIQNKV